MFLFWIQKYHGKMLLKLQKKSQTKTESQSKKIKKLNNIKYYCRKKRKLRKITNSKLRQAIGLAKSLGSEAFRILPRNLEILLFQSLIQRLILTIKKPASNSSSNNSLTISISSISNFQNFWSGKKIRLLKKLNFCPKREKKRQLKDKHRWKCCQILFKQFQEIIILPIPSKLMNKKQ